MAQLLTPRRTVHLCGALASAGWAGLSVAASHPPVELSLFFGVVGLAWLAVCAVGWRCRSSGDFPLAAVLLWGLVFRLVGLFAQPVLEDDHYRYLWDGRTTVVEGNPYGRAPEDFFGQPGIDPVFERLLDGINNPDVPTIYAPVAQLVFAAGYLADPGAFWPIKLVLLLADVLTGVLLLRVAPRRNLLWYAWCPLLIHETAFNGHVDSLAIFFAVAAACVVLSRVPRPGAAGALAALAVATKPLALLLLPLLAARLGVRRTAAAAGAFAAGLVALYLPFVAPLISQGRGSFEGAGLAVFLRGWEFNSTLFALGQWALGREAAGAIAVVATLGALGAAILRSRSEPDAEPVPRGEWVVGCFFLFAPVVNPWYLLWLLPFVVVRPSAWGLAALAAVPIAYCHGLFLSGSLPAYHHPGWVRPLELGLVLASALAARGLAGPSSRLIGGRRGEGSLRESRNGAASSLAHRSLALLAGLPVAVRNRCFGQLHGEAESTRRVHRPGQLRAGQEGLRR